MNSQLFCADGSLRRLMASVDGRYPSAACMGLAFCLAWLQSLCPVMWGEGLAWASVVADHAYSTCVHTVLNLGVGLAVIAAGVFERRLHALVVRPTFLLAGGGVAFCGTLAMFGSLALALPFPMFAVVCFAASVGMGMVIVRCEALFGELAPQRILLVTAASWTLGFGMDLMVRSVSPGAAVAFVCLLPCASVLLLMLPAASGRGGPAGRFRLQEGPALRPPRTFWQFVLTVFLVMWVAETVIYFNSNNEESRLLLMRYADVAVVLASGLLVAYAAVFPSSYGYTRLYHVVVFGVMLLLGMLFVPPVGNSWALVVALAACQCFNLLLWCLFCFVTHQSRLPALKVFGYGYGFQLLGATVGYLLGQALDGAFGALETDLLPAYLVVAMIALAVAMAVYPPKAMQDVLLAIPDDDAEDAPGAGVVEKDAWSLACEGLADAAHLTAREREIMVLLARGRGSVYISEYLGVALSTVYTHTRNLYRKLGVHSREELMRAVDGMVEGGAVPGEGGPMGGTGVR